MVRILLPFLSKTSDANNLVRSKPKSMFGLAEKLGTQHCKKNWWRILFVNLEFHGFSTSFNGLDFHSFFPDLNHINVGQKCRC
jgi:hypothetical protein